MKYTLLIFSVLILSTCSADKKPTADAPLIPPMPKDTVSAPGIPDLTLNDLEGKAFNVNALGENPVVVFFSPDCDHCQREATAIQKRKEEFKGRDLYFVSIEESKVVSEFRQEYGLTDPQFHFATGDLKAIHEKMGEIPSVPCFFIYKNGKLAHRVDGEADVDELLEKMR